MAMQAVAMNGLGKLLDLLSQLEAAKVAYVLEHKRRDSLTVCVTVPDEKWQVEFFVDGKVEIKVFRLAGIEVESALSELLKRL